MIDFNTGIDKMDTVEMKSSKPFTKQRIIYQTKNQSI